MSEIEQILRVEIEKAGIISFARFMELSLYCPEIGYYERTPQRIGRAGDYYTSVSVGSLFGELLALQLAEWLAPLPGPLRCLEAGAQDGQLALDILNWLSQNRADLLARLHYCIVEPSRTRQNWQRSKLEKFAASVHWTESLRAFPEGIRGAILSNELLDAFPVHRLFWDAPTQTWLERGVGIQGDRFVWRKMGSQDWLSSLQQAGLALPPEVQAVLPNGFTIDFSPQTAKWWGEAGRALSAGKLLTIDYGLTDQELLSPRYASGTLRGYLRQHVTADPLTNPGEQDLTAHVNFSLLQRVGENAGLRTELFKTQSEFLTGIAQKLWAQAPPLAGWTPKIIRQFQTLTHPGFLGTSFRVLVQGR